MAIDVARVCINRMAEYSVVNQQGFLPAGDALFMLCDRASSYIVQFSAYEIGS